MADEGYGAGEKVVLVRDSTALVLGRDSLLAGCGEHALGRLDLAGEAAALLGDGDAGSHGVALPGSLEAPRAAAPTPGLLLNGEIGAGELGAEGLGSDGGGPAVLGGEGGEALLPHGEAGAAFLDLVLTRLVARILDSRGFEVGAAEAGGVAGVRVELDRQHGHGDGREDGADDPLAADPLRVRGFGQEGGNGAERDEEERVLGAGLGPEAVAHGSGAAERSEAEAHPEAAPWIEACVHGAGEVGDGAGDGAQHGRLLSAGDESTGDGGSGQLCDGGSDRDEAGQAEHTGGGERDGRQTGDRPDGGGQVRDLQECLGRNERSGGRCVGRPGSIAG